MIPGPEAWKLAIQSMKGSYTMRSLKKTLVVLKPFESQVIHGLVRGIQGEDTQFITESFDNESNYLVCPRVVKVDTKTSSCRIQVKICNITAKTIAIRPKAGLCQLSQVKVINDLDLGKPSKTLMKTAET
jgi:hypothetical protein